MEKRFRRAGVDTVVDLLKLSIKQMSDVWGSRVLGERWYYLLRGDDLPERPTARRTLGHSHVLGPDLRTDAGSYAVLVRLAHKAAGRMRAIEYWAGALGVEVRYEDGSRWANGCRFAACQDTPTVLRALAFLWADRPRRARPMKVGMVLSNLVPARSATPSLFEDDRKGAALSRVLDQVNREFGASTLFFGSMFGTKDHAPTRIGFTRIPDFDRAFD
jgi:DNA polymerase-4